MAKTVLIVDDVDINRQILRKILGNEHSVLEAENGKVAIEILMTKSQIISAVLLDLVMPVMDGFEVLTKMKSNPTLSQIPVIVTTSNNDRESEKRALALGATDFVAKPYDADILRRRLDNLIRLRETSIMVNTLQKDRLTGLWNRETFFQKAGWEIKRKPAGHYLIASLDIDNFKVINDQFGSEVGDRVLKALADIVQFDCADNSGVCGRVSADNFAVLYPVANLAHSAVEHHAGELSTVGGLNMKVTLRLGRYVVDDPTMPVSAMFDRATLARLSIKGRYDRHVAFYDESMRDSLVREQQIVAQMSGALADGQFEPWYQPQYNHATGAIVGAEALVRWRHPERGLVPPGEFVPVFERNGFVYELDKYVWGRVCSDLRGWINAGRKPLPISVNISRYDLFRDDLVDVIVALCKKYDITHELLRLEITESAFADSTTRVVDVVKQFISLGFTVEIDDFGSGYSSLNTLKDVPAQILKLDMRFLENSGDNERGGNIIESIIRMAKWLGMAVIAEGVERVTQADYLKSVGCNYIQGYLYARPMPADDYFELARSIQKEERLITLETVENLDNNAFWDPESMDTLIFNSYVGAAAIFECAEDEVELVRVTDKFVQTVNSSVLDAEKLLQLDWNSYMDANTRQSFYETVADSRRTRDNVTGELVLVGLPGCPEKTYLRFNLRIIATAGERSLIYFLNENITAQREAEENERRSSTQLAFLNEIAGDLLAGSDIEESINSVLHKILVHYGADRAYIIEQRDETRTSDNTYEVCADGVTSEIANLQGVPFSSYGYWMEVFAKGGDIVIDDVSTLPDERAAEREILSAQNIHRLMAVPFNRNGRLLGFIGLDNPTRYQKQREQLRALSDYLAVMLTRRDLTNQIESEQRRVLNLMDDTPGGFVQMRLTEDNRPFPVFVNQGFCDIVDMTREEFFALYAADAMRGVHPDDLGVVNAALAEMFSSGESRSAAYRLRHGNDGDYVWVRFFGRMTTESNGDRMLNIYYTDASKDEQQELNLRETIPFILSAIMDSSPDLAFAKDRDFRYICCSPGFVRFTGQKNAADVIGKTDYEIWTKEEADHFRTDDIRLFESGESLVNYIEPIPSDDGIQHYSNTSKFILRDGAGEIIGLYGMGRDITDARAATERLNLINDSLPGGIAAFAITPDGIRQTYYNDGFCRLFDYTREQYDRLPHGKLIERVFPEDRPMLLAQIDDLVKNNTPIEITYRSLKAEGDGYVWIKLSGVATERTDDTVFVNAVFYDFTSLYEAQQSERQTSDLLAEIMQNMSNGVSAATVDGKKTTYYFANDRFFEILGYTREQFEKEVPDGLGSLIHPDDFERINKAVSANEQQRAIVSSEFRVRKRDGSVMWMRVSGSVFDMKGVDKPVHVSVHTDITRAKNESNQLRLLTDSVPGGLATYVISASGVKLTYFSDGYCDILGYTHDEYEKTVAGDVTANIFEQDVPIVFKALAEAMENKERNQCVYRIHHKDGGLRWVSLRGQIVERSGDECRVNVVMTDITERQQAIERLSEDEERFRIAAMMSGAIISRYDIKTRRYFNADEGLSKQGMPAVVENAPQGFIDSGFVDPQSAPALHELYDRIHAGESPCSAEATLMIGDGSMRACRIEATVIPDSAGKPSQAVIVTHDISEQLEAQRRFAAERGRLYAALEDFILMAVSTNLTQNSYYVLISNTFAHDSFAQQGNADDIFAVSIQSVPASDVEEFRRRFTNEALQTAFAAGVRTVELEHRHVDADGVMRWVLTKAIRVDNEGKDDVLAVILTRDITERKHDKELLQKTYDMTVENMPGFIAKWQFKDGDVLLLDANSRFLDFLRAKPEAIFGKSIFSFGFSPDDRERYTAMLYAAMEKRELLEFTTHAARANGGVCWLSVKASFFGMTDGYPVYYGTLTEVTELVAARDELRISREEYRVAAAISERTVLRYDIRTDRLTVLSQGKNEISFSNVDGKRPKALIKVMKLTPEQVDEIDAIFAAVRHGDPMGKKLVSNYDGNGEHRWSEWTCEVIRDSVNAPAVAIISIEDVTDKKNVQEQLSASSTLLDITGKIINTLVVNLTTGNVEKEAEGVEGKLSVATGSKKFSDIKEMYIERHVFAEDVKGFSDFFDVDRAIALFESGVNEETFEYRAVNNDGKLRWMVVRSRILRDEDSGELRAYIVFTDNDVEKKKELLVREKAELDPLTGVLNRVTFASLAERMISESSDEAQCALLMLDIDGFKLLNDTFGHAAGDQALIEMANSLRSVLRSDDLLGRLGGDEFLILLKGIGRDEAVESKAGQICALLRKAYSVEVQFSVSIGIAVCPRDGQSFEVAYHRADSALYAVKNSGKNNIAFYHPDMREQRTNGLSPFVPAEPVPDKEDSPRRRMLIVEDDDGAAEIASAIFASDFIVERVKDGANALIRMRHYGTSLSIVLLDLVMPRMSGFEVLERMRSGETTRNIPVVVVSGDNDVDTGLKVIRAGASDFVPKPIDPSLLRIRVESAISKAENERLRAQNSFLTLQNDEVIKFRTALKSTGAALIEHNWKDGTFSYDRTVGKLLAGDYDDRRLWTILLADKVAISRDVQQLQNLVHAVANDRKKDSADRIIPFKTPSGEVRRFRVCVSKLTNEYMLTDKLILTITDAGGE